MSSNAEDDWSSQQYTPMINEPDTLHDCSHSPWLQQYHDQPILYAVQSNCSSGSPSFGMEGSQILPFSDPNTATLGSSNAFTNHRHTYTGCSHTNSFPNTEWPDHTTIIGNNIQCPGPKVLTQPIQNSPCRPFKCLLELYGCTASFGSKDEWKRHINMTHLKMEGYRCNEDLCKSSGHTFTRKDQFAQHIQRKHRLPISNKQELDFKMKEKINEMAESCHLRLRDPPSKSICGHCRKTFSGLDAWSQKLDHVSEHIKMLSEVKFEKDEYLEQWLRNAKMLEGGKLRELDG